MIQVQNLVKRYGDTIAVDNVSFTIEKGQVYGFLGPNGAGKSTTMNILTGYIGPTSGQVIVNGHDILEEPDEARRCIGYLPEQPPLYMDMVVYEYLMFCAQLKKVPKKERDDHLKQIMTSVGLEQVSGRLIRNLSKGYKQRVGLAQALVGYPEILILDEPTVGLDPKQIIEVRDLIRSLSAQHTIIFSSHILSEVQAICDRVLVINRGKLVAAGTTADLERRMSSSSLILSIKGYDADKARALFGAIPGIESIHCSRSGIYPDELIVNLDVKQDADIRQDVYRTCVDNGVTLLMLKPADISLENVFLELTSTPKENLARKANKEAEK